MTCSNCGAPAKIRTRCWACHSYYYRNGVERPWRLITRLNTRRFERHIVAQRGRFW